MMSPEGREIIINPKSLFPIGETAVKDALYWMSVKVPTQDERVREIRRLQTESYTLFSLVNELRLFREDFQFPTKSILKPYENGALFMINALKNQCQDLDQGLEWPKDSTLKTYFFNLIDVEINHCDVPFNVGGKNKEDRSSRGQSNPFDKNDSSFSYTVRALKNKSTGMENIADSFVNNSGAKIAGFFSNEPIVREVILNSYFKSEFGPPNGLMYGALDVYEVFRLSEESKKMENWWDIKLKWKPNAF